MKRFRFRLERVLQYRKTVREEKKRELMRERMVLFEQQEQLSELERAELAATLADNTYVTAGELQLLGHYKQRLKSAIVEQKLKIIDTEDKVEKATQIYIEAAKEEEALATLKRKKVAEYREYVGREEDKFLDELSVQRIGLQRLHKEKGHGSNS